MNEYERQVLVVRPGDVVEQVTIDMRFPWSEFVPIDSIVPNPAQPREFFDEKELGTLEGSISSSIQAAPVVAVFHAVEKNPKIAWMINDGERRIRSMKQAGATSFWIVYNPKITKENIFRISTIANLCRVGHTNMENAKAIERLLNDEKLDYAMIASLMGFAEPWVRNKHRLVLLHPLIQALIDAPTPEQERIPLAAAHSLTYMTHEEQLKVWGEVKDSPKRHLTIAIRTLNRKAAASSKRGRRPSDEAGLVVRGIRASIRKVEVTIGLPETVFASIPSAQKSGIQESIAEMRRTLDKLEAKILGNGKEAPGRDESQTPEVQAKAAQRPFEAEARATGRLTILPEKSRELAAKPRHGTSPDKNKKMRPIPKGLPPPPPPNMLRAPQPPAPIAREELPQLSGDNSLVIRPREPRPNPDEAVREVLRAAEEKRAAAVPAVWKPVVEMRKPLTAEEIIAEAKRRQSQMTTANSWAKPAAARKAEEQYEGPAFTDADFGPLYL